MSNKSLAAETLHNNIETAIIEGSLRPGAKLPPERVLAAQYKISRAAVREALQWLKARQWIVSKQGGGHYVSEHLQRSMAGPIERILEKHPEARLDLLEFRHSIEGECAYYAALRANDLDKDAIASAFNELQRAYDANDIDAQSKADARFHLAIAEASHNLIYLHLIQSLFELLRSNVTTNITDLYRYDVTREKILYQHQEICDAILSSQPSLARDAAYRHIHYVEMVLSDLSRGEVREQRSQRRNQ